MGKEEILLSPNRVTVLRAPSETGKSVLTNFLDEFVSKDCNKETYSSIVRRGATSCGVQFKYDDDSTLLLYMQDDVKAMLYTTADGKNEDYINSSINEDTLQKFGIIVDEKNGMLINVFSRNNPLLFVDTDEFFNGALLSRVLIDKGIERVQDYLKEQEISLKERIKDVQPVKEKLDFQLYSLPYTAVDNLNNGVKITNTLIAFCNKAYTVEVNLKTVLSTNSVNLDVLNVNTTYLENFKKGLNYFDSIGTALKELPHKMDLIKDEILNEIVSCIMFSNTLKALRRQIVELDSIKLLDTDFESVVDRIVVSARSLNNSYDFMNVLVSAESASSRFQRITKESIIAEQELGELREEIKVCPLCGGDL